MVPPAKRRKTESKTVEEITFDPAARQEYLTGFHKRKLQRTKLAQEAAEKRAKAERVAERRKLREERKADLERHVQEINALLRPAASSDDSEEDSRDSVASGEWNEVNEVELPPVDHEEGFIDEDKYTIVTVEAMDVSKEGLLKADEARGKDDAGETGNRNLEKQTHQSVAEKNNKRKWTKEKPKDGLENPKKKRKKFRYENKAERKFTRLKEKSKNNKQAKARRSG